MFDTVEDTVAALKAGEIVVLTDNEDRENGGDLIMAGSLATPDKINFMLQYGRGVLCVPVSPEEGKRLSLSRPAGKHDPRGTAFTQTLDAIAGCTTGVSAADRANTILKIADPKSTIEDFYSPGHVNPLLAVEGGVLKRDGHTEGTLDLLKLAGLPQIGVLIEILNPDGTMARVPQLEVFCKEHDLRLCSIEKLIAYLEQKQE